MEVKKGLLSREIFEQRPEDKEESLPEDTMRRPFQTEGTASAQCGLGCGQ